MSAAPLLDGKDSRGSRSPSEDSSSWTPSFRLIQPLRTTNTLVEDDRGRFGMTDNLDANSQEDNKPGTDYWIPRSEEGAVDKIGLLANTVAGLVCGIKISVGMVVFASLMWSQTAALSESQALGVKMNYLTATILLVMYSLFGGIPFGMVLCQDIPSLLLGKMGIFLAATVTPEHLVPTFVALIMSQAILSGLVFYTAGVLKWTGLVQQVPHAVVGGFVASCGAGLWKAALVKLTNVPWAEHGFWPLEVAPIAQPANLSLCFAGFLAFLCIIKGPAFITARVSSRAVKSLVGPFCMLAPVAVFYVVLAVTGFTVDDARDWQWLAPPAPAGDGGMFWEYWQVAYNFKAVHFQAILDLLPSMVACALLSLLESVFNVAGIDSIMTEPIDLSAEIKAFGIANVVAGFLGANTGYLQGGMTLNAKQVDQASHKWSILVAATFALTLFVSGLPLADYVPKFTLGAIFLVVGYFFLKKWLWDSKEYLPWPEYVVVWAIMVVSMCTSIHTGMVCGMVASVIIFVVDSASVRPIAKIVRADSLHSKKTKRKRTPEEIKYLHNNGRRIMTISCNGFLFWAKAREVVNVITRVLEPGPASIKYLLVDLTYVPRLDVSAMKAFEKCLRIAKERGIRVGFCCLDDQSKKLLEDGKLISTGVGFSGIGKQATEAVWVQGFDSLDAGLEFFEDELLMEMEDTKEHPKTLDDAEMMARLIKTWYDGHSEWQGVFVIAEVSQHYVNNYCDDSAEVSAKYSFRKAGAKDLTIVGTDFRQFKLAWRENAWVVLEMMDNQSGRCRSNTVIQDLPESVMDALKAMPEAKIKTYDVGDEIIPGGQPPEFSVLITGSASDRDSVYGDGRILAKRMFALRQCGPAVVANESATVMHMSRAAMAIFKQQNPQAYIAFQVIIQEELRKACRENDTKQDVWRYDERYDEKDIWGA